MSATRKPAHFHEYRDGAGPFQSGAPLQPGATQPEHDGVAHETKSRAREWLINGGGGHEDGEDGIRALTLRGEDLVDTLEAYDEWMQERLTTLLERMARLVVAKLIPHQPLSDDNNEPWRCSMTDCEWKPVGEEPWVEWREHVRDVIESRLQQLREAVERP